MLLTNLWISEMTDIELWAYVKNKFPDMKMIMINGYTSVDNALKVLSKGVLIAKPVDRDKLLA